jgi:hypothetical protein
VLSSGFIEHGVTLSSVLSQVRVDEVNKIISDWSGKHTWHWWVSNDFFGAIALVD